MSDRSSTFSLLRNGEAGQAVAPTNTELSAAISSLLAAGRNFRQLYGRAGPEQQAIVMASFPWPRRGLELREMTAWAEATTKALLADEPVRLTAVSRRLAG